MSWHIEGCTGACLACLLEETVLKNYGTQGLNFLRRKVGAGDTAVQGDMLLPANVQDHRPCAPLAQGPRGSQS